MSTLFYARIYSVIMFQGLHCVQAGSISLTTFPTFVYNVAEKIAGLGNTFHHTSTRNFELNRLPDPEDGRGEGSNVQYEVQETAHRVRVDKNQPRSLPAEKSMSVNDDKGDVLSVEELNFRLTGRRLMKSIARKSKLKTSAHEVSPLLRSQAAPRGMAMLVLLISCFEDDELSTVSCYFDMSGYYPWWVVSA